MNPGTQVRLTSDPGRRGVTSGLSRTRGDRLFWQVLFPDGAQYVSERQLEVIISEVEDAFDLFIQGKFGRARDLRGAITHIRLNGRLADLIYSMETTNTNFYPYQFKPVLNFLDSPSGGILIADEVGLGKTIEAGLIWTELRSRYDTRRLMILCPAMLREKWKMELRNRFGITASIANTDEVLQTLQEYKDGNLSEFAIVASMQGLRPNRGWDDDEYLINNSSARFARFLTQNAHDESMIDLLIIDEAHYLRNPLSMTSKLSRLLRDVSEFVVLLSATPIHLKNTDLYQLLNLVDEDSFNQVHVFDDILQANAPLIQARDMVLLSNADPQKFVELLEEARSHYLLSNNRQLQAILDDPPNQTNLSQNSYRSALAYRLEAVNLLGRAVTRTRKREVTEWMVIREAFAEIIEPTPVELEFYKRVTSIVRQYCLERDSDDSFLLVTPQRQISSSMPAALRAWQKRKFKLDQIYEDLGLEYQNMEEIGPLVKTILENVSKFGNLKELWDNDSKYKRLSAELKRYLKDHPKEKIVVFAYFRPTLSYLHERLTEEGIKSIVLVGGEADKKYEAMEHFKNPEGPSVLLASEVASEGVDLQFSRVVVNYDLPWNPMKVEQRIGRIDRLGQISPKIAIWNLFYDNTIDARIYARLYQRLGIFQHALGGMEAILGDEIKKLTVDLLRGTLTPEQEEARILQTEQAISNLRKEEERLEQNATNLIAHGDYILHQVRAARELGRWITGDDLWIYIKDFFNSQYPGCEFRQIITEDLIFDIKLSEDARFHLDRYIQNNRLTGQTRLTQFDRKYIRCHFKNQVSHKRILECENINQFHPLTRFVSESIQKSFGETQNIFFPTVSLRLNKKDLLSLLPQDYVFYVEKWTIQGVKDIEKMVYYAIPSNNDSVMLSKDDAERLVTIAAKLGTDWLSAANELNTKKLSHLVEACMNAAEQDYGDYIAVIKNENNDRADLQEKSLKLHLERQTVKLNAVLLRHEEKGNIKMIAPTRGLIEKMKAKVNDRIRIIEEKRKLQHHSKDVCLGIIRIH